jgi:hypothetical protein
MNPLSGISAGGQGTTPGREGYTGTDLHFNRVDSPRRRSCRGGEDNMEKKSPRIVSSATKPAKIISNSTKYV